MFRKEIHNYLFTIPTVIEITVSWSYPSQITLDYENLM